MPTFADAWRSAAAKCSAVDPLIVRDFAQGVYKHLAAARIWSWRRAQAGFRIAASRDLTATFTADSTTVTSTAAFVAADLGREIRVGTYPIYTIAAFVSTSEVTLDRAYEGSSGAETAQILDAYVTVPDTFDQFILVIDPVQQCRIGHWYTQEELSMFDPVRQNTGSGLARGLFAARPNADGLLQYEVWPYSTAAYALPYWYATSVVDLTDDADLPGILRHRADVIETGARAECAKYPGTPALKNPYFNLELCEKLERELADLTRQIAIRDDDQYAQDLVQYHTWPLATLAPTADYLRRTDAPASMTYI